MVELYNRAKLLVEVWSEPLQALAPLVKGATALEVSPSRACTILACPLLLITLSGGATCACAFS